MNKFMFYAETIEGCGFKVLFEIIKKSLKNYKTVNFKVNKNGIFICMLDDNIIIDSSFYAKFMKRFVFNGDEEEFRFGITHENLSVFKKIKKEDILSLSIEKDGPYSRKILIKISNYSSIKYILDIQNYKIEIPQGYCDFPINLNKSSELAKLWKDMNTNDDKVNIQLMKNTIKLSFHDTTSITIGENDEILYENVFKTRIITNIIKISSFGTLRIYHNQEEDLPLLFSAMIGCGSGYINIYVSPDYDDE